MTRARRHLLRLCAAISRRALPVFGLWLAIGVADVAAQSRIDGLTARFGGATERYAHGVLGDAIEWTVLSITADGTTVTHTLPRDHVFEDLAPRPVDLNLDGVPDAVMVVETDMALGAALALYDMDGKIAETPHIGRSHRWLAPVGAADLDGDGFVELAYVDRPHLAKTLRIWRYRDGRLSPVAEATGLTNHKIGQDFISGGIRACGSGPEMVTADAGWARIMSSRLIGGRVETRDIGPFRGTKSMAAALDCR